MPCPFGLALAHKLPDKQWKTRAELIVLLERAREEIIRRPTGKLRVSELAAEIGLSPCYFNRLYRQTFGQSPGQHRAEVQLAWAAAQLKSTSHSVTELCELLGRQSHATFSREFHRKFGCTPTDFRKFGIATSAVL